MGGSLPTEYLKYGECPSLGSYAVVFVLLCGPFSFVTTG
jgi:hypothetical protein